MHSSAYVICASFMSVMHAFTCNMSICDANACISMHMMQMRVHKCFSVHVM